MEIASAAWCNTAIPVRLNYFSSCSEIPLTLLPIRSICPIYRRHCNSETPDEIGRGCSWKILPVSAAARSANLVPQHCSGHLPADRSISPAQKCQITDPLLQTV